MMTELLEDIRKTVEGDAWHGPSLMEAYRGLTPLQAAARPVDGAHSIQEILQHAAAWMEEAAERLEGRFHEEPEAGDWRHMEHASERCWSEAQRALRDAYERLAAAAGKVTDWSRMVGEERNAKLGTGVTYAGLLRGVAQHNAYHAGQIALLRKSL
ncbi:MAG: DinB family protein [Bryobacteraceae bacterium]|nr:DinB family protein [Bryobacteraceae bacterium]